MKPRLHFPAFLVARCGNMTKFWPKEWKHTYRVGPLERMLKRIWLSCGEKNPFVPFFFLLVWNTDVMVGAPVSLLECELTMRIVNVPWGWYGVIRFLMTLWSHYNVPRVLISLLFLCERSKLLSRLSTPYPFFFFFFVIWSWTYSRGNI